MRRGVKGQTRRASLGKERVDQNASPAPVQEQLDDVSTVLRAAWRAASSRRHDTALDQLPSAERTRPYMPQLTFVPNRRLWSRQAPTPATTEQSAPGPCLTSHRSFVKLCSHALSSTSAHSGSICSCSLASSGWLSTTRGPLNEDDDGADHRSSLTPFMAPPRALTASSSASSPAPTLPTWPPRSSIRFLTFSARSSTNLHFFFVAFRASSDSACVERMSEYCSAAEM